MALYHTQGKNIDMAASKNYQIASRTQTYPFKLTYHVHQTKTISLGLSMGRSRSGLCPTRNRPDQLGSLKLGPAANPPEATVRVVGRRCFLVSFRSGSNYANRCWILPKSAYFCLINRISKRSWWISTRLGWILKRSQLDQARSRWDLGGFRRDQARSQRDQARSRQDLAGSRQIEQNRPANYFNRRRKLFPVGFSVRWVENRFSML